MGIRVKPFGFDKVKGSNIVDTDTIVKRRLQYIGEELCTHARTVTMSHADGGYDDQTGNLRSSIGYRIYHNGEMITEGGFQAGFGTTGGSEGIQAAKEGLETYGLAHGIDNIEGWTLVLVAGMNYAYYVQEKYGYNVLHLTTIEMEKKINELKEELHL